jgi:outer membrane receptor protein involved in Fe transport
MDESIKNSLLKSIYLLVFFLSTSASNGAIIKGRITDSETHKPVSGAVVSIEGTKIITVSDVNGNYSFNSLQPGTYILIGSCMGFKNSDPKSINLSTSDASETIDFNLNPSVVQMKEVVVTSSQNKETNSSARHDERVSSNIVSIISAKTIEALPDLTVANVLQRVSGVSMMKNSSGNNTQLVIRGMSPRYNSTLVNGTIVPTTSGSTRAVPMDIFPSVFVGRIEVTKALTPDMEASGLGGLANIVMKNAPDTAILSIDMATGYNQYLLNHKFSTFNYKVVNLKNPAQLHGADYLTSASDFPTANLVLKQVQAPPDHNATVSYGNRFFNKKLGLLISASIQTTYQTTINNYLGTALNPNTNNLDTTSWNRVELYNQINRKGLVVRLDYSFNDNNRLSFSNNYFSMDEIRARHEQDTTSDINKGRLYFGDFTNMDKSSLENAVMHGNHFLSDILSVDWSAGYSVAGSQSPDYVSVNYNQVIQPGIQPEYLNYRDAVDRIWQWNNQNEKSVYINVNYKPWIAGHLFEFKSGVMGRDKHLMNNENDYQKDFTTTSNYPYPDVITIFKQNLLTWLNDQQLQGDAVYNSANFKAHEDIGAAYVMIRTSIGKLQLLTGVRFEITSQSNTHNGLDHGQKVLLSASQKYSDFLPSLHLNYQINDKHNMRFSVYEAINRPNISETVPYTSRSANGNSSGNPDLKHTTGTCFDARYEFYPEREEVLSAGVFYKYLKNPIEEQVNGNNDRSITNAVKCTNYGFELVTIKYLGNIGISANYTYTKSSILQPKNWNDPTANNGLGATLSKIEDRPLAGQSPHLINISLLYRNNGIGLTGQITYTMQGKNLININSNYGLDGYQLAYNDLGASLEKRIFKNGYIYLKGANLLNESVRFQTKNGINTRTLSSQKSFLIGLKFNL